MNIGFRKLDDVGVVYLSGDLNIYHVNEVKKELFEAISNNEKIAIDASRISEVDSSGIQLLLSAKIESESKNKVLKIINHSPPLIKVIDLMGLVGFFGDKLKIPVNERNNYSLKYGIKKRK